MQPVLALALCIIVGVSLAGLGAPWLVLLPAMLLCGLLLRRQKLLLFLGCMLVLAGYVRGITLSSPGTRSADGPLQAAVHAVNNPILTASGYYRGVVRNVATSEQYLMYWSEPWSAGFRLEVEGEAMNPTPPQNPGELDYAAYLDRQGVAGLLFVRSARLVARYRPSPVEAVRGFLRRSLAQLPPRSRGLALALVLGDRSHLSREDQENWRKAGASHLLAVSGLHIGIAAGAAYALARRFSGFRLSLVLASGTAMFYAALVGSSASAWRAALAFALVAVAKMALREAQPINILGLVAAALLLINPLALKDPGFLLSFAATFGLVWLGPSWKVLLPGPPYLRSLLAAALSAQLATLPLLLGFFGAWPTYGLITNLLLVPFSPVLVGFALLTGALGRVPGVGAVVGWAFSLIAWFFSSAASLLGNLPGATVNLVALPGLAAAAYYVLLLLWPKATKSQPRVGAALFMSLAVLVVLTPALSARGEVMLTFLAVGNADACHVRVGHHHYLIDTGTSDAAERIVIPYLRAQGVNALAGVFISHGHDDHVGGLRAVRENFRVSQVFAGPQVEGEFLPVVDSMQFGHGATKITALQAEGSGLDLNNQSIVLWLEHGLFSALFCGDIGHPGERLLLPRASRVKVLKVGHHGSATSSSPEWLQATAPEVAVISVGENSYGHPSAMVLLNLTERGTRVFCTDEDGAVRVLVKKDSYQVYVFTRGRWQYVGTYALSRAGANNAEQEGSPSLPLLWGRGVVCGASQRAA